MTDADIGDIRRLRFRTVAIRGLDDLNPPVGLHRVRTEVATRAVRRLRLCGSLVLLSGLALLIGFAVGATVLEDRSTELADTRVRTQGFVVEAHPGSRGL